METKHIFTAQEFNIIIKALEDILGYVHSWGMKDIITCQEDFESRGVSMSVETFIEDLRRELNIEACDCGCHTSESSDEEMIKNGCDNCQCNHK